MTKKEKDTRKDDLRTGDPFWLSCAGGSVNYRADPGTEHVNVIIVGGGISGAMLAEALTRSGRTVLVVDRREPVRGSTPASTAMIQHEIDVPLTDLRKHMTPRAANAAWRRSVRAVNDLIDLTGELKIDCNMQPKPALYLAGDEMDGKALEAEAAARRRIGIQAEFLTAARLQEEFGMSREGAILSHDSASANPAQLAAGLLRAAQKRGAVIAAPVEITDVAELPSGVALATADGRVLTADHAVFCTGYEFLKKMQSTHHHVTSTWAIATKVLDDMPAWMRDTIVWEASDPYLYFRADPSGRLIVGGEDEESSDKNSSSSVLKRKSKLIVSKLEALTGVSVGKPEFRWAAPFSVTDDGLPIIDRVKDHERVFAIMGFGGNGITFSMIAAQIVMAAIDGHRDPDASLFALR
ncbi:MAG: NAD(P)/FAD-dependent oxidoreductase [Hyphomonas sp.]